MIYILAFKCGRGGGGMSKVYALLVGINDYPDKIGKLQGCLNDVANVGDYLASTFPDAAIVTLKDHEATRDNLIGQFRSHLGRAGKDDVALFHYCGHGSWGPAAPEFRQFDLTGEDEGLVCIDSRDEGKFDLADKELAALIAELARNDPHIAVILDCCHSGSGTRALEAPGGEGVRTTGGNVNPRTLETYLGGHFAALRQRGEALSVPIARHILLAACTRLQKAKEDLVTHQGIFTTRLLEVLRRSAESPSYADLFVRTRAAVRRYIAETGKTAQDPQFETFADFDGYAGFLGRGGSGARRSYSVHHEAGSWRVDCGAIQGMPTDPSQPVQLSLRPEENDSMPVGIAQTVRVGAQKSDIRPGFEADPALRYRAEIISLPAPPLLVGFEGDPAVRAAIDAALVADAATNVALTDSGADEGYVLVASGGQVSLKLRAREQPIRAVPLTGDWTQATLRVLRHVAQWQRSLALTNPKPKIDPRLLDFVFAETLADGGEHIHAGPEFTLDYVPADGGWRKPTGTLKLRNRTGQRLHFILLHFSDEFGISVMANDEIPPKGEDWMTMIVGISKPSPKVDFWIGGAAPNAVERLKLIVSTERVDDFLLALEPLASERGFGSSEESPEAAKPVENDWFVKDLRVTVERRLDQVGPKEAVLAGGLIKIEPHPSVTANLTLAPAPDIARDVGGGSDFVRALELRGLSLVDLAGTRGEGPQAALELTDISNAGDLESAPLHLRIESPTGDDEAIAPLLYDGQHVLLAGDSWRDEAGTTHVSIDSIPAFQDEGRGVGGALKMYFFKTYLGRSDVNQLRWIEFRPDGSFAYRGDGLGEKVAAAGNILLVMHGIIGDTKAMVDGVQACGLDTRFDLVLSYDYENLATPIEQTASSLGASLAAAGFGGGDGKTLTLLVHSMGGLVARWLIERGGGADLVDHLVLCGTPSAGSPFGNVDGARKVLNMLATVSLNYAPMFAAPALWLLSRSKRLTPTLEQMNPQSAFIAKLNASADPGVRYTILAGDVDRYQEPADDRFAALLAEAGRGTFFDMLFANRSNDIAVGIDSINGVADRGDGPVRQQVGCHHLNYFSSLAGRQALQQVRWEA